jgi:small subunit ribosomal protein S21
MMLEKPISLLARKGGVEDLPFVKVRENEPFDRAFRRFTKSCEKSGLMAEIRRRQRYEKPSEIRKRMENAARRKLRKMRYLENR